MKRSEKAKAGPKFRATGCYAVLRPDGKLWLDEVCVCEDADILRTETLPNINEGVVGKCRIVELYVRESGQRQRKGSK